MRLSWSRFALSDRDDIFTYIETNNPIAAVQIDQRIAEAAQRLLQFPESGRPGRIVGTRELVIPHTPYIAAYLISGEVVRILRILHGARRWPDEPSADD